MLSTEGALCKIAVLIAAVRKLINSPNTTSSSHYEAPHFFKVSKYVVIFVDDVRIIETQQRLPGSLIAVI